jgi:hypothetical protein
MKKPDITREGIARRLQSAVAASGFTPNAIGDACLGFVGKRTIYTALSEEATNITGVVVAAIAYALGWTPSETWWVMTGEGEPPQPAEPHATKSADS